MARPRKSAQHSDRIAAIKEQVEPIAPVEWEVTPGWAYMPATGPDDTDILSPIPPGYHGEDTTPVMLRVTRAEYVRALKAAVESRELCTSYLEPEMQERSWRRFVANREGDHGLGCWRHPACIAKHPKPAPPRTPAGPAVD